MLPPVEDPSNDLALLVDAPRVRGAIRKWEERMEPGGILEEALLMHHPAVELERPHGLPLIVDTNSASAHVGAGGGDTGTSIVVNVLPSFRNPCWLKSVILRAS